MNGLELIKNEESNSIHIVCHQNEVIGYQVKMLQYQKDFFGLEFRWIQEGENQKCIWYYKTLDTLKSRLHQDQLEVEEYLDILNQIYERIMEGRQYLLEDQHWYLNLDYLFLGDNLLLLYIPIKSYLPDIGKQWLELITRLVHFTDPYDPVIRKLNQQLHIVLSENVFSLEAIGKLIKIQISSLKR